MIAIVALVLGFVAVASAQAETGVYSVMPTVSSVSEHYSYPYTYVTYYSHHKKYVYTYETCSSPPSSVEVCLSSIFMSIEKYLTIIDKSLMKYEISIRSEMSSQHSLLYDEISWVEKVNYVAKEVKEAVYIDYQAEFKEVKELILEKEQIEEAYSYLYYQMDLLEVEIENIEKYEKIIVEEYYSIYYAKWSVYYYISAIIYEKGIIEKEEVEIEKVVEVLYEQIEKIEIKIAELNKRQGWLVSWEEKLYVELSEFQSDVKRFKEVEEDLKKEEISLYAEQKRMFVEVEYVEKAMEKLKMEYVHIVEYLKELEVYEKEIYEVQYSISYDASIFISAYSEFTCEDSLLYYEACDSSKKASAAAAVAPAHPAKPPRLYAAAPAAVAAP